MDKEFGHSSIHSVESKSTSDPISTKDVPVVEVRVDVVSEKDGGNVESGLSNIAPQEIDGGAKAWLQVFGAWFLFLNSWQVYSTSSKLGVS